MDTEKVKGFLTMQRAKSQPVEVMLVQLRASLGLEPSLKAEKILVGRDLCTCQPVYVQTFHHRGVPTLLLPSALLWLLVQIRKSNLLEMFDCALVCL